MTERDWLESTSLQRLVGHVGRSLGVRKLWLFNAACCRRIAPWFPDERARSLIDLVELHADGSLTEREWAEAFSEIVDPYIGNEQAHDGLGDLTFGAIMNLPYIDPEKTLRVAGAAIDGAGYRVCGGVAPHDSDLGGIARVRHAMMVEEEVLCDLFRCVVGNPFRPIAIDPAWRTSTVVALATGIDADRAFERMPILADALQDAGCDSGGALSHCRSQEGHTRGCWVVDAILGKA